MANREELLRLADFIETFECAFFFMPSVLGWARKDNEEDVQEVRQLAAECGETIGENWCGTYGCIAGFAWLQDHIDKLPIESSGECPGSHEVTDYAMNRLGLTEEEMYELFYPDLPSGLGSIRRDDAALAVRKFADTDVIDYSHVS